MIRVDPRAGSRNYLPLLQAVCGVEVEVEHVPLAFGDIAWMGHGPSGARDQRIGVEVKSLADVLQSLDNGRLVGHQLPGMLADYDQSYLLVTGEWRVSTDGSLLARGQNGWHRAGFGSRRWNYNKFIRNLTSMQVQGGMPWFSTASKTQAAHLMAAMYHWWQTPWSLHTTGKMFHAAAPPVAQFTKASLIRSVAKELPEIGWEMSLACDATFASVAEMMTAPACVWADLRPPGMTTKGNPHARLGPKRAAKVVAAIMERR